MQLRKRNQPYGNWMIRRRFMFAVSAFCAWAIVYVLVTGKDTRSAETAVEMAFWTLLGITGSYVFGATWEDIHRLKQGIEEEDADVRKSDG